MTERSMVVLVGADGEPVGVAGKLAAHTAPGRLHRAFSVVLYRPDGAVLLQQRAAGKYHFPGAWANACCSHPLPGEALVASAERRVAEELGLTTALSPVGRFTYRAQCPRSGLVEHEDDHVLLGVVGGDPRPEPSEVAAWHWADPTAVLAGRDLPGPLAPWLLPVLSLAEAARARRVR